MKDAEVENGRVRGCKVGSVDLRAMRGREGEGAQHEVP